VVVVEGLVVVVVDEVEVVFVVVVGLVVGVVLVVDVALVVGVVFVVDACVVVAEVPEAWGAVVAVGLLPVVLGGVLVVVTAAIEVEVPVVLPAAIVGLSNQRAAASTPTAMPTRRQSKATKTAADRPRDRDDVAACGPVRATAGPEGDAVDDAERVGTAGADGTVGGAGMVGGTGDTEMSNDCRSGSRTIVRPAAPVTASEPSATRQDSTAHSARSWAMPNSFSRRCASRRPWIADRTPDPDC
jgi:hypothetical protein